MLGSVALFAVLLGYQADPALDRSVSFSCPATQAGLAIEILGKKSGVSLSAPSPVGNELLILRFNDIPLRTAMDKIAAAATGEWAKTESGYQLIRPNTLTRTVAAKRFEARLALTRKAIADRVKAMRPFNPALLQSIFESFGSGRDNASDEIEFTVRRMEELRSFRCMQPSERLATRILRLMGPEKLASIPLGQRTVFAIDPTPMQLALTAPTSDALAEYTREHKSWKEAQAESRPHWTYQRDANNGFSLDGPPITVEIEPAKSGQITRLLMIATPDRDGGSISLEFKLADAAGVVVASENCELMLNPEAIPSSDAPPPAEDGGKAVELSPLVTELRNLIHPDQEEGIQPKPISEELKRVLLSPERNEPLAVFASDQVLKAAQAKNVNLAVSVDDNFLNQPFFIEGSAQEILGEVRDSLGQSKFEGGWLIGTTPDPLHPVHESRAGLGVYLRAIAREGRVSLNAEASYSLGVPDGQDNLGRTLGMALLPQEPMAESSEDWDIMRLYGSLELTQRQSLLSGAALSLENLSLFQQGLVRTIVYGREAGPQEDPATEEPDEAHSLGARWRMISETNSLLSEPTLLLPNGLDPRITLRMSGDSQPMLFAATKTGETVGPAQVTDPDSVAMSLAAGQNKDIAADGPFEPIAGYQVGRQDTFALTLSLPEKHADAGTLNDLTKANGKLLSFDQLPEEMKAAIAEKVEERKKFFKEWKANGQQQWVMPRRAPASRVPPP